MHNLLRVGLGEVASAGGDNVIFFDSTLAKTPFFLLNHSSPLHAHLPDICKDNDSHHTHNIFMNSRSNNGASLPYFGNVSTGRRLGGNNSTSTSNSNSNINNGTSNTRRLSPAKFLVFLGLCIVSLLALSRIFTPAIDSPIDKPGQMDEPADDMEQKQIVQQILDSRKSSYSFDDFTDEGLAKTENEHLLPTTAVLLGWKRIEGLKLIVNYLARYPYIKQIIVWNNNKDITLSKRDFAFDSQYGPRPELQVYNAAENLHDIAKYMSCSLAKYKHCYFQDDDWLNTHMDALYTNFLTSPSLLHTNTQPLIQMEHRRWTFTNESKCYNNSVTEYWSLAPYDSYAQMISPSKVTVLMHIPPL